MFLNMRFRQYELSSKRSKVSSSSLCADAACRRASISSRESGAERLSKGAHIWVIFDSAMAFQMYRHTYFT